jgi:hypothetical protein
MGDEENGDVMFCVRFIPSTYSSTTNAASASTSTALRLELLETSFSDL